LLTRLWQRASTVTWYQRHAEVVPSDAVDYTTPAPVELVEPLPDIAEQAPASEAEPAQPFSDREEPPQQQ